MEMLVLLAKEVFDDLYDLESAVEWNEQSRGDLQRAYDALIGMHALLQSVRPEHSTQVSTSG